MYLNVLSPFFLRPSSFTNIFIRYSSFTNFFFRLSSFTNLITPTHGDETVSANGRVPYLNNMGTKKETEVIDPPHRHNTTGVELYNNPRMPQEPGSKENPKDITHTIVKKDMNWRRNIQIKLK